ncbi:hypothetical protein KIN20_002963 [Parelaphostrongylus tenuis]|uniref:Uncharacterized protein n=1 Tax=Parelaphostrongylus tenuis TaxID=148309 RepID=A0AAD5QFQ2_PARTN|nr:hypothetical protein KIN20_002963 [Parelaphostrongylus tenuis]
MSEAFQGEKKKNIALLCEEIENLTRDADETLGEVVKCRKTYPVAIGELKMSENRERFARLLEAPLKSSRPPKALDVEWLQNDITRTIDKCENLSKKKEALEARLLQLRNEQQIREERCKRLEELVNSEKYAPIHALPDDFVL